jgi:hypothetical protein
MSRLRSRGVTPRSYPRSGLAERDEDSSLELSSSTVTRSPKLLQDLLVDDQALLHGASELIEAVSRQIDLVGRLNARADRWDLHRSPAALIREPENHHEGVGDRQNTQGDCRPMQDAGTERHPRARRVVHPDGSHRSRNRRHQHQAEHKM